MAALMPMAVYGLEVPCGDVPIPARPDIPSAFRITMAAIDPTAEPEDPEEGVPPRATLKILRQPLSADDYSDDEDDEDDEDFDIDEMERMLAEEEDDDSEDDDEEDETVTGGPSDPAKSKKARKLAAQKAIAKLLMEDGMDVDDEEDSEDDETPNGVNGVAKSAKAKGKMPAAEGDEDEDEEDDEDDDEDDDSDDDGEVEEFVLCTLDPQKNYQQPIDITIGENERVYFVVTGTHSIYLTGNYVEPIGADPELYDPEDDEDEDYDLEPDEDELDSMDEDEEDELDDIEDPRVVEIEEEEVVPKLVEATKSKKDSKKRSAPSESADEAEGLDEMIQKEAAAAVNGEKLSKKQAKKQKKNDGTAAEAAKAEPSSAKSDKKVSFAKELEQGPTPTKGKDAKEEKPKAGLGVKVVQGVTIDDKKLGTGPAAKSGDRVGMRYIGKLQKDGKVFDSNKKGKPFTFKLGSGEVIKGWDIGIQGMSVGSERRITIPAHLAYGSKGAGTIPGNATLIFDVKLLEINKGK